MNFLDILKKAGNKNFRRASWDGNGAYCYVSIEDDRVYRGNENFAGEQRFCTKADMLSNDWEVIEPILQADVLVKVYPLELQNVGSDTYELMSKGHHDSFEFMNKVKEEYPTYFESMGLPEHRWARLTFGRFCLYKEWQKGTFPVTWCSEGRDD